MKQRRSDGNAVKVAGSAFKFESSRYGILTVDDEILRFNADMGLACSLQSLNQFSKLANVRRTCLKQCRACTGPHDSA